MPSGTERSRLRGSLSDSLDKPLVKVRFYDASDPFNQDRRHTALFNPTELMSDTAINAGALNPVGSTGSKRNYGHTLETQFSLMLEYSAQAWWEHRIEEGFPRYQDAYRFFLSFCYPDKVGGAPPHLVVVWPNTLVMKCVVESVRVNFRRWDPDLQVRDYVIDLDLSEVDQKFLSTEDVQREGFHRYFSLATAELSRVAAGGARAGKSLKLASGKIGGK